MNTNGNKPRNPSPEELSDLNDRIARFGAILVAIAVVLFCFAFAKVEASTLRIVLFLVSGLLAALGIFILVVVAVGSKMEKSKTNYFLYDKKTKQNILPSELTVGCVRERIARYMAAFKHRGRLYIGELFELPMIPETFKPLFCYELLCQIAEDGNEKAEIFLSYGNECLAIFSKYLTHPEDYELVREIRNYMVKFSGENKTKFEFVQYLIEQKCLLEERMLSYTIRNIDKF